MPNGMSREEGGEDEEEEEDEDEDEDEDEEVSNCVIVYKPPICSINSLQMIFCTLPWTS